jgi:radical SAM-linked protein
VAGRLPNEPGPPRERLGSVARAPASCRRLPDVDARSEAVEGPTAEAPAEVAAPARQRWRLLLARSGDAPELGGRDATDAWETALEASGLPLFRPPGRPRPRIAFGAPIPARLALEGELADIVLTEFVPTWRVREGLAAHLPHGWRLVDVHDVWLGGPALAGQVVAADYRMAITGADADELAAAATGLLNATALPRERLKGGSTVRYDLRPLLADVGLIDAGPPVQLRARTRFDPVLGTGRPEEVVAALGDGTGSPLVVAWLVRERVILGDEMV